MACFEIHCERPHEFDFLVFVVRPVDCVQQLVDSWLSDGSSSARSPFGDGAWRCGEACSGRCGLSQGRKLYI